METLVSFTKSTSESQGDSASSSCSAPTVGRAPTNKVRSEMLEYLYFTLLFPNQSSPAPKDAGSIDEDKLRSKFYSRVSSHPDTSCYLLYASSSFCFLSIRRWLCTIADKATGNIQHTWVTFRKTLQYSAVLLHAELRSLQPTAPKFGIYYHFPLYRGYHRNTIQNLLRLTSKKSPRNNAPFVVLLGEIFPDKVVTRPLPRS